MRAWQEILRKRFDPLWQDPPELTVLVGTPGWGRSTWLKQCMDHQLIRPSVLITTRIGLQRLLAAPERDLREMMLFIDDVLISAADELWPELTELLADDLGCRAVVTSMDLPPVTSSEDFEIHVLDERDLAFDPDEIREVIALNNPDAPPDEIAALHTHLRGCPVLVRRQLDRLHAHGSRPLWANADAALERTLVTETLTNAATRFGRIMELATSFRTFSADVLVSQLPAFTREEVEADFARLQASPLGRIDYSDDNADEVFVWRESVWQEVGKHEDPDLRRRRLKLARDATQEAGCVNGELYYHLHLGDLAAAERLAFENSRYFLLTIAPPATDLLRQLTPDQLTGTPNLLLLIGELHMRTSGSIEGARRFFTRALRQLEIESDTTGFDLLRTLARQVFASVALGDRTGTRRRLRMIDELLGNAENPGLLAEAPTDPQVMQHIAAECFLPFRAATQLDDHKLALRFATVARTHRNPSSRSDRAEAMMATTEEGLLGVETNDPTIEAGPLFLIEQGRDADALESLRTVSSRNGRGSMSDAFLLATRSLLAPRSVPGEEIWEVYVRSRSFWNDQKASTFVALAATFAYLVNDDFDQAARIVDETHEQDWFTHLARGFLVLRQGDASAAVESLTAASATCSAPRSIAITGVLLAAAHLHLNHTETAATTLHTAFARSSGPLIRFALRLVPSDDFQALNHLVAGRDPELESAFVATDPRPLHGPSHIRLTNVERELITLLRQGLSNAQIAEKRIVSINTVRT